MHTNFKFILLIFYCVLPHAHGLCDFLQLSVNNEMTGGLATVPFIVRVRV